MSKKHKQVRVPEAHHAELSEYSSLLRTFWTEDTQDVAQQLARHTADAPPPPPDEEDVYEEDVNLTDSDAPPEPEPEPDPAPEKEPEVLTPAPTKKRRKQRSPNPEAQAARKKRRMHSLWVRWPLPLEDTTQPEWDLPDQMRLVYQTWLTQQPLKVSLTLHSHTPQVPPIAARLADGSQWLFESMLGTISSLMPKRPLSTIHRIQPISWENVLEMCTLRCHSLMLTPELLDRVRDKMTLYVRLCKKGDTLQSQPVIRQRKMTTHRPPFGDTGPLISEDVLFEPVPEPPPRKTRRARAVKSKGPSARPRKIRKN